MISVIIPSYNRRECILALLRDVSLQDGVDFEVIVIDDCSSDDSVEAIRRDFPEVKVLVNERNGGPCVTRNRGVMVAKGEFVIGLDSDVTVPDRGFLAKAAEMFGRHPEVTGLAFRIMKPDGKTEDSPRWWHPLPIKRFAGRSFLTSYFSGTAYAFRKEEMIAAGMFPEVLYMHYEEVELALRIIDRGGSIMYCPEIRVLHHANEVSRRSEVNVYYRPRNQILVAVSCYPLWKGVLYVMPRLAYQFSVAARRGHMGDFRRAMKDALSKSRAILPTRRPLKRETFRKICTLREGLIP